MRVAIDAQFLDLPPSGIGAYVRNLVANLPTASTDVEVRPLAATSVPGLPRALANDPRLRRCWWEAVGSGREAEAIGAELLHIPSFAAPLRIEIPFVVTIHDAIPFQLPEYRASWAMRAHLALMRRTTARAQFVLTPSEVAASDLERVLGVPRERLRVTPLAADPACRPAGVVDAATVSAVRSRFDLPGPYVFTAAGLDMRKRVDLLLEAFAVAIDDLPSGATLVIAGRAHTSNARVFPQYLPLAERLGIAERVRFTGWIDEATKVALYQGAAAAVTASFAEGFGLTVLEGMACGAPVIAAHRSSLPEVAGGAAMLVEPTVAAWRHAMVRVLTDSALASDLRDRGLERASQFDWRATAAATAAVYHEAIAKGRRG